MSDPRWKKGSRSLLSFLKRTGPSPWSVIFAFGREHKIADSRARQLLAYLEVAHEANAMRTSAGVWVWYAVGYLSRKRRKAVKTPPPTEPSTETKAKFDAFWESFELDA